MKKTLRTKRRKQLPARTEAALAQLAAVIGNFVIQQWEREELARMHSPDVAESPSVNEAD